jgi:hypothetical protein
LSGSVLSHSAWRSSILFLFLGFIFLVSSLDGDQVVDSGSDVEQRLHDHLNVCMSDRKSVLVQAVMVPGSEQGRKVAALD